MFCPEYGAEVGGKHNFCSNSLPPVQLSVLMAVKHGISNTEIIAKMEKI